MILVLDSSDAAVLSLGMKLIREYCRKVGMSVPPVVTELEAALAAHRDPPEPTSTRKSAPAVNLRNRGDCELLTYAEAAVRLRVSLNTVKRRVAAGVLVPVRHGRITRLAATDVDHLGKGKPC